jgi:hypothetical protein
MIRHAVHLDGHKLSLSNLDKVLYPATGFTKAQVINYYSRIAEVMLPHLRGRPISLRRYPNGVDGHSFFQKNCPGHRPDWMRTVQLPRSDRSEEMIDFCMIGDLPSLIWVANLASLEIHPYLHFAKQPQRPTLGDLLFNIIPDNPFRAMADADMLQIIFFAILFGIGAALPLLGLGWLSRETMARWRGRLLAAGSGMKSALGLLLLVAGMLVISGADKALEAFLVDVSPEWLTNLTTRF